MEAPKIVIKDLDHEYVDHTGERLQALAGFDLEIRDKEVVAVVGPSGCGKSTLLNIVAGLVKPTTEKRVLIDGTPVVGPGSDRGVVFQEFALLPWRTVERNVGHGLEIRSVPKSERAEVVQRFIQLVGLTGFEKKYPHTLSGGMKQRAAVARTLAADPVVMLMDEPFAAIDAQTRMTLQEELVEIFVATNKTSMIVTHSVDEAVFLADRVVVMSGRPGRVKELVDVPIERADRTWAKVKSSTEFNGLTDFVSKLVRAEVGPRSGTDGRS